MSEADSIDLIRSLFDAKLSLRAFKAFAGASIAASVRASSIAGLAWLTSFWMSPGESSVFFGNYTTFCSRSGTYQLQWVIASQLAPLRDQGAVDVTVRDHPAAYASLKIISLPLGNRALYRWS